MRNLLRCNYVLLASALGASVALFSTESATANGWGNNFGFGIGGLYRTLDQPTELRVPYFASRPPVYYSQPVPRTYGHSPFSYGPWHQTPEILESVQPVMIENKHLNSSASNKTTVKKPISRERSVSLQESEPKSGPLMIDNPYYSEFH